MVERSIERQPKRRATPFNGNPKPGSPFELILESPRLAEDRFKKPAFLINENESASKYAEGLPMLYGDSRVRFDPLDGSIRIRSWRRSESKKKIPGQETLKIDVPKVSKKRWSKFDDIESAIRSSIHIIEKNRAGGQNIEGLNKVINLTEDFFERFTSGDITPDNLPDYLTSAYTELEDSHLLKAKVPNKKEAALQIIKALGKDSLERFNSLISRTRLAASIIKLQEEILLAGQTQEKYNYLLVSLLLVERNTERFYIQQIIDQGKEFLNLSDENKEFLNAGLHLKRMSRKYLSPDLIFVAPYRQATVFFDALVFGWPVENFKGQRKLFSSMFPGVSLDTIDEIHKNPRDGNAESIAKFRRSLASGIEILENTLDRGERNLETV